MTAKLTIASIDDTRVFVTAQFNPKELQLNQPIEWHDHETLKNKHGMFVEFGSIKPETMQVELLFDGAENGGRVEKPKQPEPPTVMDMVNRIKTLASSDSALHRPHYCVVTWGDQDETRGIPRFRCVIDSVATKFLMFSPSGIVLRASCTVSLRSADRVALARRARAAGRPTAAS